MAKAELIVADAGFAGLCCARSAALRGVDAILLERKADPGQRPHPTGLLVKEVADEWENPTSLTRKVHGVRFYASSLQFTDLSSPGYYFLATDTPGILRWLAREATAAGAQIHCRRPFRGARSDAGTWRLEVGDLGGCYLVGADGVRSAVARDLGLGVNRAFLFGVEVEFEGAAGLDPDRLHVFLTPELARGYMGWAVPGLGVTRVGIAARTGRAPARPVRAAPERDFRLVEGPSGRLPRRPHPLWRQGPAVVAPGRPAPWRRSRRRVAAHRRRDPPRDGEWTGPGHRGRGLPPGWWARLGSRRQSTPAGVPIQAVVAGAMRRDALPGTGR